MGVISKLHTSPGDEQLVIEIIKKHIPEITVWAHGSRVKGTAHSGSDLDLVVFAKPEHRLQVADMREDFEESSLPFRVDLLIWDELPDFMRDVIRSHYVQLN